MPLVAPRPVGHELDGQRTPVAKAIDVAREAPNRQAGAVQLEAQSAAFAEVVGGVRLYRDGRAHDAHPGQASATAARFLLSSLA